MEALGGGGEVDPNMPLPEGVSGFMNDLMQSLLSKDVLYGSMKEIGDKYPQWLQDHRFVDVDLAWVKRTVLCWAWLFRTWREVPVVPARPPVRHFTCKSSWRASCVKFSSPAAAACGGVAARDATFSSFYSKSDPSSFIQAFVNPTSQIAYLVPIW